MKEKVVHCGRTASGKCMVSLLVNAIELSLEKELILTKQQLEAENEVMLYSDWKKRLRSLKNSEEYRQRESELTQLSNSIHNVQDKIDNIACEKCPDRSENILTNFR